MSELDLLTIGLINDIFTERENDDVEYDYRATQGDFDATQINFQNLDRYGIIEL
jgi:hypothetical protein